MVCTLATSCLCQSFHECVTLRVHIHGHPVRHEVNTFHNSSYQIAIVSRGVARCCCSLLRFAPARFAPNKCAGLPECLDLPAQLGAAKVSPLVNVAGCSISCRFEVSLCVGPACSAFAVKVCILLLVICMIRFFSEAGLNGAIARWNCNTFHLRTSAFVVLCVVSSSPEPLRTAHRTIAHNIQRKLQTILASRDPRAPNFVQLLPLCAAVLPPSILEVCQQRQGICTSFRRHREPRLHATVSN